MPVLGEDGKVPDELDLPASRGLIPGLVASDEFERKPGERALPLVWQWNHNLTTRSVADRAAGVPAPHHRRVDNDFLSARNTLTQRTFGPESAAMTALDLSQLRDGDVAGLALLQKNYGLVGVKAEGGTNWVVMVNAGSGRPLEVERVALGQKTVFLKAECDFRNRADTARFFFSLDGETWTAIGNELKMSYTIPHFMGYRFGLFYYATKPRAASQTSISFASASPLPPNRPNPRGASVIEHEPKRTPAASPVIHSAPEQSL